MRLLRENLIFLIRHLENGGILIQVVLSAWQEKKFFVTTFRYDHKILNV